MPARPKMDLLLAKPKPVSGMSTTQSGNTSGIMYLFNNVGNTLCTTAVREEGEHVSETAPQEPGSVGRKGMGWPRGCSRDPLQPTVQPSMRQLCPEPCRPMGEQTSICSTGGAPAIAGGCSKEALWEAHTGAGSLQDPWHHEERSPKWSRLAGRTCDPTRDPARAACS